MPDHIRKSAQILSELDIEEPILGYSFVKVDPVPDGWDHLLEISPDAVEEELHQLSDMARGLSSIITLGTVANVKTKIAARDGSLEIIAAIIGYFALMFSPEIKQALKDLWKNRDTTPNQAANFFSKMFRSMSIRTSRFRSFSRALRDATLQVLEIDPDFYENIHGKFKITAEGRIGIFGNWEKFHEHFSGAKNSSRKLEDRARSLEKACRQLEIIKDILIDPDDRDIFYMYLEIRTRGDLFISMKDNLSDSDKDNAQKYNETMHRICEIRDHIKSTKAPF